MKFPKNLLSLVLFAAAVQVACAQESKEITKDLKPFRKVIVSPRVNLILEQGDHEGIRLVYNNVTADKINIQVSHHTLRVYLDDAKVTERNEYVNAHSRHGIYHNVTITAYVTYKELEHLEIRGNQELTCTSPLRAEKFVLKAYGENEITLASVKAEYMKTSLYGENKLRIKGGKAEYQKYKLFGENKIDTQELKSYSTTANIFGESNLKLNTQDQLKVNAFGESQVSYQGDASVNRGLIFGHAEINKLNN